MLEYGFDTVMAAGVERLPLCVGDPPLVRCGDGRYYWVRGNTRLRNDAAHEAVATRLATVLGLSTPTGAIIHVGPGLAEQFTNAIEGWNQATVFGLAMPGDGSRLYDHMPKGTLGWIENINEVAAWRAFDVWVGNAESTRALCAGAAAQTTAKHAVRALKIDHARCFEGFANRIFDRAYAQEDELYGVAAEAADCREIIDVIGALTPPELDALLQGVPEQVLPQDYRKLLLEGLLHRQSILHALIVESLDSACLRSESLFAAG